MGEMEKDDDLKYFFTLNCCVPCVSNISKVYLLLLSRGRSFVVVLRCCYIQLKWLYSMHPSLSCRSLDEKETRPWFNCLFSSPQKKRDIYRLSNAMHVHSSEH